MHHTILENQLTKNYFSQKEACIHKGDYLLQEGIKHCEETGRYQQTIIA